MKKHLSCFLIITLCVFMGSTFAQVKREQEHEKEERQSAEASGEKKGQENEIGIWDGFRGIKWATPSKELSGLIPLAGAKDGFSSAFSKKNDSMEIGDAKLSSIHYLFVDGSFAGTLIVPRSGQDKVKLAEALIARFGIPNVSLGAIRDKTKKNLQMQWCKENSSGNSVGIDLDTESFPNACMISYGPLIEKRNKHAEDILRKKQDALNEKVKKDF